MTTLASNGLGLLSSAIQAKGKEVDFYHADPSLADPVDLGRFQAKDGKLLLRAEVIGSNQASRDPRFYFGLDCFELR